MNLKNSFIVISLLLLSSLEAFGVRGGVSIVKVNQTAAQGKCLVDVYGDSAARLAKNNITTYTGTRSGDDISFSRTNPTAISAQDTRSQSVVKVMQTLNNIGNGRFDLHKGAKFVFGSTVDNSRQEGDHIQINQSGTNQRGLNAHDGHNHGGTTNVALITHELGHYVGNKGMYGPYFRAVRGGCNVSGYAQTRHNGRNEEFAEAFAAYITNPELLSARGGQCQKALDFFRGAFGETVQPTCTSRLALAPRARAYRTPTRGITRSGIGWKEFISNLFSKLRPRARPSRTCASVSEGRRGRAFCNPTPTTSGTTGTSGGADGVR